MIVAVAAPSSGPHRDAPGRILERFRLYKRWQQYWFFLHYAAGFLAISAGALTTASGAEAGPKFIQTYTWVWGLAATVLSGIVTLLGPLQKAESYKHAYYRLSSAIIRYESHIIEIQSLFTEFDRAQNIVLIGDPSAKPNGGD